MNKRKLHYLFIVLLIILPFSGTIVGTILAINTVTEQKIKSATIHLTYNNFFVDPNSNPNQGFRLLAPVIDIPAGAEIVSMYMNIKQPLQGGDPDAFYASIQSPAHRCDPVDPNPTSLNSSSFVNTGWENPTPAWDFNSLNPNGLPVDVPGFLARDIICDTNNPSRVYLGARTGNTDLFTSGAVDIYINYLEH